MNTSLYKLAKVLVGTSVAAAATTTVAQSEAFNDLRKTQLFSNVQLKGDDDEAYILVDGESKLAKKSEADCDSGALSEDHNRGHGIKSAIEFVSQRSRIKDQLLSSDIPPTERDRAWEQILIGVRDVLSKPEVMDEMIAVVRKMKPSKLQEEIKSITSDTSSDISDLDIDVDIDSLRDSDSDVISSFSKSTKSLLPPASPLYASYASGQQWDEIVAEHSCMICQDLLAAPVITSCSHSFCGMCLINHMDSIQSCDVEVMHPCPMCAKNITYSTYEMNLDEVIVKKVQFIYSCKSKDSWSQRRNEYLADRKKNNRSFNNDLDIAIQCAIPVLAFIVVVCFVCL